MYIEINPYRYQKERKSKTGYMVQICQNYTECSKEEMINKLIIDLETLKSKLEEERYKGRKVKWIY